MSAVFFSIQIKYYILLPLFGAFSRAFKGLWGLLGILKLMHKILIPPLSNSKNLNSISLLQTYYLETSNTPSGSTWAKRSNESRDQTGHKVHGVWKDPMSQNIQWVERSDIGFLDSMNLLTRWTSWPWLGIPPILPGKAHPNVSRFLYSPFAQRSNPTKPDTPPPRSGLNLTALAPKAFFFKGYGWKRDSFPHTLTLLCLYKSAIRQPSLQESLFPAFKKHLNLTVLRYHND